MTLRWSVALVPFTLALTACTSMTSGSGEPSFEEFKFCDIDQSDKALRGRELITEIRIINLGPHGLIAEHPDCPDALMRVLPAKDAHDLDYLILSSLASYPGAKEEKMYRLVARIETFRVSPGEPGAGRLHELLSIVRIIDPGLG